MSKVTMKGIYAVMLATLLAASGYGYSGKKDRCLGNHACKRVFYLLSAYHPVDNMVSKKAFQKLINKINGLNIVMYQMGQTYQVYIPHEDMFYKGSSNLVKTSSQVTNALGELLQVFKPKLVEVKGLIANSTPYNPNKPLFAPADLARKQARILAREVKRNPRMREIEFIDGETIRAHDDLAFWQIVGGAKQEKTFTVIEFKG